MKRTIALGLFSLVLIFAFAAVPVVGILSVSVQNAGGENLTLDIPDSVGTGTVDTPPTKRQLQKKYAKYNTVTEENGKSVVTIFSEEQIDDFNARRNNGEWFWLSTEEMLFLIEDTISLFETYDIVYIRGLDGVLHKYYGLSFFSSEEYFASFGGFDLGVTDASFDYGMDVYHTILNRAEVFVSAYYPKNNFFLIGIEKELSETALSQIQIGSNPWHGAKNTKKSYWQFKDGTIKHMDEFEHYPVFNALWNDITNARYDVFPNGLLPDGLATDKYDQINGKTVVIELYDNASQELIARLRFDEANHPEEILQFTQCVNELKNAITASGNVTLPCKYRAVVYLNGFPFFPEDDNISIWYHPDGEKDYFTFAMNESVFQHDFLFLKGSLLVTEYANSLLSQHLISNSTKPAD